MHAVVVLVHYLVTKRHKELGNNEFDHKMIDTNMYMRNDTDREKLREHIQGRPSGELVLSLRRLLVLIRII
jgi:hypothetical protein